MWPYWLLFFVPTYWAITRLKPIQQSSLTRASRRWPVVWWAVFFFFVGIIGFRHEVGGDWDTYLAMLDSYTDVAITNFTFQDPGFIFFNWLSVQTGFGIYLLNTLSAAFFSYGLFVFCRAQPRPWLALVVAVPYLVTVVAMGYTRQAVAIGIAMIGMVCLGKGKMLSFLIWIGFASLFHKSAVILVPLAFLANSKNRILNLLLIGFVGVLLYFLLLQEAMSFLIAGYIEDAMQSSGAGIRVAMNAVPAAIFLLFRKRFKLERYQNSFWYGMSWSAILIVVLLLVSPSSTAVDRIALYWIPLQLFVLSRLPNALGRRDGKNASWVTIVVMYSATVHFVWLFYAATAFAWVPYKFYPWVWLGNNL